MLNLFIKPFGEFDQTDLTHVSLGSKMDDSGVFFWFFLSAMSLVKRLIVFSVSFLRAWCCLYTRIRFSVIVIVVVTLCHFRNVSLCCIGGSLSFFDCFAVNRVNQEGTSKREKKLQTRK
jgi:hypothetical protein